MGSNDYYRFANIARGKGLYFTTIHVNLDVYYRQFNEYFGGHFSVTDSVLRQMPRAYAEDVHGTSIKTLI